MHLLAKKIKSQNISRSLLLLAIAIIWRIIIGDDLQPTKVDPYIFPVVGFFIASVIFGELTRRIYRATKKEKRPSKLILSEEALKVKENQADREALNFGIMWGIVWVIITTI